MLFNGYNAIQVFYLIYWYFFGVLKFQSIHGLKQLFQLFVKNFCKSFLNALIFFCCSSNVNIVFFKQFCQITSTFRPIIALKHLWVFKHTNFFINCFQQECSFTCFVGANRSSNLVLYLDVTSTIVNMTYMCSLKRHYGTHKANQTDATH